MKKKWFGNVYGGFYIHSKGLDKNSIVYSVGIGEDISFDLDIIQTFSCDVYAFDPTPKSIQWVKNKVKLSKFIFHDYGVSNSTEDAVFFST